MMSCIAAVGWVVYPGSIIISSPVLYQQDKPMISYCVSLSLLIVNILLFGLLCRILHLEYYY